MLFITTNKYIPLAFKIAVMPNGEKNGEYSNNYDNGGNRSTNFKTNIFTTLNLENTMLI